MGGNVQPEWWDWSLANLLSAAQAVLTAAGFIFAWIQLRRTAAATESSVELLEKLRVRLVSNDLMVILPDLHDLEDQLDAACNSKIASDVERVLVLYSRKGGEILGLVEDQTELPNDALANAIRQAIRATVKAKAELSEGSSRSLFEVTASARRKIATVSHEASSLKSRLQRKAD